MLFLVVVILTCSMFACFKNEILALRQFYPYKSLQFTIHRSKVHVRSTKFDLDQALDLGKFLSSNLNKKVVGVFALEDPQGKVLLVESSSDVVAEINRIQKSYDAIPFRTVRLQTFDSPNDEILYAYKMELARQTIPSILTYQKEPAISKVSPFEDAAAGNSAPDHENSSYLELTVDNVNFVLEEVRPYLIADGGNVAVKAVHLETRSVELELQGACGSCPSSTV